MIDDIVARLRGLQTLSDVPKEAADEITRLRAERDELRAELAAERVLVDVLKKACLAGIRAVSATEEAESEAIAELSDEREAHKKTHDAMNEIIIENTRLRAEIAAAHGNADDNYKKLMEAHAERDALRELLRDALAHLKTGQWDVSTDITLMARIDAALNKGGEDE